MLQQLYISRTQDSGFSPTLDNGMLLECPPHYYPINIIMSHSSLLYTVVFFSVSSSLTLQVCAHSDQENSFLAWSTNILSLRDKADSPGTSQSFNASSVSLPGDFNIECNGRQYGRPNPSSCHEAWQLMPPSDRPVTFADRSQEIASDIVLPWRFPSCK